MDNEALEQECKNCWEFMKCPIGIRNRCIAYTLDSGKECWFMANLDKGCLAKKGKSCFDCPWFKKNNPEI